ncbi:MAG: hypothetical protein Q8P41_11385 [Pseudomonadota bacterium]|nr:hypothetical protein [Pseudomonadota bacterium]
MILLLAAAALADPTFTDLGLLVTAPAEGPFAGGVNAPTVAWTGTQYVMYFESPALAADVPSDCANSYSIGRATSPDGLAWTVDAAPVLAPDRADPVSLYSCSVASPGVVYADGVYHLFFAMGDERQDSGSAINRAAGIAYATSTDGVTFAVQQAPTPIGDYEDGIPTGEWHEPDGGGSSTSVGMPTVTLINDTLYLLYLSSTSMYGAKYDLASSTWSLWDDAVSTGWLGTDWAAYGVYSPALYCSDDETLTALVGGYTDASYVSRGVGVATSPDLVDWTVGAALAADSVPFDTINHVEVLPAGADLLLFYGMTDTESGKKAIGMGTTSTSWGTPDGRACEWEIPVDTGGGDTDTDTDADTDTDTDPDTDTDTAEPDTAWDTGEDVPDMICACTTGGGGAGTGVLAIALGALALGRRRRG